jgi:hypothetical protein
MRDSKRGKAMNKFFCAKFSKTPNLQQSGESTWIRSFHSSTIQNGKADTLKFTNKGEVWNKLCAVCLTKERSFGLSHSLYSG